MQNLIVTFGLHLDGQRSRPPANALGEVTVGPLGFLNILETQLGLLGALPSQAKRIVQYRKCLKQADSVSRFYHQTFQKDELGTAATLLSWRDLWYLHGWDGQAGNTNRIRDLVAVEELVRKEAAASGPLGAIAQSIGERLQKVLTTAHTRQFAIDKVILADPIAAFPKRWREVLEKLPVQEMNHRVDPIGTGFLGTLQERLQDAVYGREQKHETAIPILHTIFGEHSRFRWHDDGTVVVARSENRFLAGNWAASQLQEDALLVAPLQGPRLDSALTGADLPRHGLRDASAFRPALQVLPLALEILWEPFNFYGLVQFLSHPVCPLPGFARRRLAEKIADYPGIGGKIWDKTLEKIDKNYGENAAAIRQEIAFWVEHPRHQQSQGAPVAAVMERVERLAEFFRGKMGSADEVVRLSNHSAYAQCVACAESLRDWADQGEERINPRQLEILVAQATAQGTVNPLLGPEVGCRPIVTEPGAVITPVGQVIWWQMGMPVLPRPYSWSKAEIADLAAAGVDLPTIDAILAQTAKDWLKPILAAQNSLILVLPPEGEEVHPLWQMIQALFEAPHPIKLLEALLAQSSPETQPVTYQQLPQQKRWWTLPEDIKVSARAEESFSSLEQLIFNPYQWLLRYPAKLKSSSLLSVTDSFRMYGNLAHHLIEELYGKSDALSLSNSDFDLWFVQAFDEKVRQEGAILLMPGKGSDLENFRFKLRRAVMELRAQISGMGAEAVTPEQSLKGSYSGGMLAGSADLVAQTGSGEFGIIDMKWGGAKKYPEKLKNNTHLQLAIYAELLRQSTGKWPEVAYYIISQARFYAPDDALFGKAQAIASKDGENTAQLWQRFLESWQWRQAQFNLGQFEVAIKDIEETKESTPPEGALPPEYMNETYNEYLSLAGWGGTS